MGFDRVSNGEQNPSVEEMVDEAAAVLEVVANDSWVEWGARVLPNVVARVKAEGGEGSESVSKAPELLFAADVEKDVDKDIARREARHQEKLEAFLDERITQEEFERDSEGDAAMAERSEATGDEELVEVESQISGEMDVDSGEDEVVSVATRKRAPSLPPKTIQKKACATAGSQDTVVAVVVSQVDLAACERCLQQGVTCIRTGDGTRCVNCHDKHTRCSFVPAKVGEGKSALSGVPHAKPSAGPQTEATSNVASEEKEANHLHGIKSGRSLANFSILSSKQFCRASLSRGG